MSSTTASRGQRWHVPTMDCAAEEAEIRRALDGLDGVHGLHFQLGARVLTVDADAAVLPAALAAVRRAGFEPRVLANAPGPAAAPPAVPTRLPTLAGALLLAIAAEAVAALAPDTRGWQALGLALAAVAIVLAGPDVFRKGWAALRQARLNINALMTVAVSGAVLIGEWPEAAMVMVLYAIAEAIEARAVDRARHAIQALMDLSPPQAAVRQPDGNWREQPVAEVAVGALVRVKPGERVPLDGRVQTGHTSIDQSPVTGESLPVDKAPGDPVFAGTLNASGVFEFEVSAAAADSTLARIIHAVEQAQSRRAPMQGLVDRFAAVYTPAVFVIALLVAISGPWLWGWTALHAVYQALVLLVIACPCALVISTPVTLVSGLTAAARRGVLVKGGLHLERARHLKAIALDKTGTLTEGRPRLVDWARVDLQIDEARARQVAGALAAQSDHPVALAIAAACPAAATPVQQASALAGRGVRGEVDGQPYMLGSLRWMSELGLATPALVERLTAHEQAGRTVSLLATPERVLALFAVADALKPSSREAVAALQALGITPVMLSGDNPATAATIGHEAGIERVHGELLPEDKLALVRRLQAELGPTAMTGDGINDAPALAQADLGIAMGAAGTDIAVEAADVVVMNDDLRRIAETVRLSRATHAVLVQNIALALGLKLAFLGLAMAGQATMWMAVFADMGASLLVVANGLRLLRRGRA